MFCVLCVYLYLHILCMFVCSYCLLVHIILNAYLHEYVDPVQCFSWSVHLEGETEHFWHCTTKHSEITIRCQLLRKAHAIYHCAWVMGPKGWKKKTIWGVPKIEVPNNRWLIMENQIKMADLGVLVHSHFRKRPYTVYIYTQTHRIDLSIYTCAQQHNIENPPWK